MDERRKKKTHHSRLGYAGAPSKHGKTLCINRPPGNWQRSIPLPTTTHPALGTTLRKPALLSVKVMSIVVCMLPSTSSPTRAHGKPSSTADHTPISHDSAMIHACRYSPPLQNPTCIVPTTAKKRALFVSLPKHRRDQSKTKLMSRPYVSSFRKKTHAH